MGLSALDLASRFTGWFSREWQTNHEVDMPTTDNSAPAATDVDQVGCSIWSAIPQILLLLRLPPRGGPSFSLLVAWLFGDAALVAGMYLTDAPVTQKFSGM